METFKEIIKWNGQDLTDKFIATLDHNQQEELVEYLFKWCRNNTIPYQILTDEQIIKEFDKLKKTKSVKSNAASPIYKHFMKDKFLRCRGEGKKSLSIYDAYYDDEKLRKALWSRVGALYDSDTSGSEKINCVFTITPSMILQGLRSTRVAFYASNFKASLGRYIISKYIQKDNRVLDYSMGWGARFLATMSLEVEYYGIDPCTVEEHINMYSYFKKKNLYHNNSIFINGYSEDINSYKLFPQVGLAFSCCPYFRFENYYDGNKYIEIDEDYNNWLNNYWRNTVRNCISKLYNNGIFILIISNKLRQDMQNIIEEEGLIFQEEEQLSSAISHLSKKSITGITKKNNEVILVFKKL